MKDIKLPKEIKQIAGSMYTDHLNKDMYHLYRSKYVPDAYLENDISKLATWFRKRCDAICLPGPVIITGSEKKVNFTLKIPDEYREILIESCHPKIR